MRLLIALYHVDPPVACGGAPQPSPPVSVSLLTHYLTKVLLLCHIELSPSTSNQFFAIRLLIVHVFVSCIGWLWGLNRFHPPRHRQFIHQRTNYLFSIAPQSAVRRHSLSILILTCIHSFFSFLLLNLATPSHITDLSLFVTHTLPPTCIAYPSLA